MKPARSVRINAAKRYDEQGFALLEMLVAFVILAVGLGAISTGVALAMRADGRAQTSRVALRLAQSRLELAGITGRLVPGHREGRMAQNYRWQETVTAVHIAAESQKPGDANPGQSAAGSGVASFWVEIVIEAADGTVARLAGLKLAAGADR
jgi:general secretion pathway protein I